MDLEGIMLSEIGQRKTNTAWSHLSVWSNKKTTELTGMENREQVGVRVGRMDEESERV